MTEEWYRQKARDLWEEDGHIEFDDDAEVSIIAEDPCEGAYVHAWIWVNDPIKKKAQA